VAAALLALVLVPAVAGCTALQGLAARAAGMEDAVRIDGGASPAAPDDSGTPEAEAVEPTELDVFDLLPGDCFGGTDALAEEVLSVEAVPCDAEHLYEAFHDFALPDGAYPDDDALEDAVWAECSVAFEAYVGLPYEESVLEFSYYSPTEDGWNLQGDRQVTCFIGSEGVPVTGSVAGAAY